MPRSNTSSYAHEKQECKCNLESRNLDRIVISELRGSNWRAVALSTAVLLLHVIICVRATGFDLAKFAVQTHKHLMQVTDRSLSFARAEANYISPVDSKSAVRLRDLLPEIQEAASQHESENVLDHTALFGWYFAPFDSLDNFVKYVCHLISGSVAEWINRPCADTISWLASSSATRVTHPYGLLVEKDAVVIDDERAILGAKVRVALDFSYCFAGIFLLRSAAMALLQKQLRNWRTVARFLLALLLVAAGPVAFRGLIAIAEYYVPQLALMFGTYDSSVGLDLARNIKMLLMSSPMLLDLLPPVFHAGTWFWYTSSGAIANVGLHLYFALVCLIVVVQSAYITFFSIAQSLLLMLHLVFAPVFFCCSADSRTTNLSRGYFAMYFELMLWMASWAVQIGLLRYICISEMNCFLRVGFSCIVLQSMICTPHIIALLKLSPASPYLAMNPLLGCAFGVKDLFATVANTYRSFQPPR